MKFTLSKTADGSNTFHNSNFDEDYHSRAGAWQEAKIKYFEPCRIAELTKQHTHITIFELGFGLGYNLIPILDLFQNNPNLHIRYISCEMDKELFPFLFSQRNNLYPKQYLEFFALLLKDKCYDDTWLSIEIIQDDVRRVIKKLPSASIDAIYHDPFSPYKNTECWTKNLFEQYNEKMKDHAILSTYSMSTPVRSGLYQAGFFVCEGIGDESKQSGTLASKIDMGLPDLDAKSAKKLHQSPDRIPFIDSDLNLDRNEIKKIRLKKKEMADYTDIVRFPSV